MTARNQRPPLLLSLCAPIPALLLGVFAMRELDVPPSAWAANLIAATTGYAVAVLMRHSVWSPSRPAWYSLTIGSVIALILTLTAHGFDDVHRWIFFGSFALHVSAVLAPVIILCVATAPNRRLMLITAAATAIVLALQPDAAQACGFAVACGVVLFYEWRSEPWKLGCGIATLAVGAILAFVRVDALTPVRHVEGIFEVISARGPAWSLMATVALLLLPMPYLVIWAQHRYRLALALGAYVAVVTIAPAWGAFPVPVMGYGVSPILGYYIALSLAAISTAPAQG